ncbi:MAG: ABC transporter permease, partial [Kitasatospora sp.]|nr:ABC transporter permease [Kitasatospora sp.]
MTTLDTDTDMDTAPHAARLPRPGRVRSGARTLRAEWTKLRTVPGTWWLLLAAVVGTVAVSVAAASSTTTGHCTSGVCHEDPVKISLTGVWLGQGVVLILGVLAMGGEYGSGTIRTTLAAVPRRLSVLAAKAAVVAGAVLVAGVLAVAGSLVAGRLVLPGTGF